MAGHSHTHIHIPGNHHRNPYRNNDYRIHCNHHNIERRKYFLNPTKTKRGLKLIFFSFFTPDKLQQVQFQFVFPELSYK
jgi:hypothetical protein